MTTTMTMTTTAVLQECAIFAYQLGLEIPWEPFYKAAMKKLAGTSTGDITPRVRIRKSPQSKGTGTMSKTAEAIAAVFVPEGMSKRDIVKATSLTPKQVATALPTMQKNGYAYLRNSRWFAGPAPAKSAAGRPPGATKTPSRTSAKGTPTLGEETMQAIRNSATGMTAGDIMKYLADNGTPARPNHIGIALQRHKRAGRLELRGDKWYAPNIEALRQAS